MGIIWISDEFPFKQDFGESRMFNNSPVEFGRNLGRPRKNLYKDILYTVGKIILSAFQW